MCSLVRVRQNLLPTLSLQLCAKGSLQKGFSKQACKAPIKLHRYGGA